MKTALLAAAALGTAASAASADIFVDLGTLVPNGAEVPSTVTGTLAPNELVYVSFFLPNDVTDTNGFFLDINTNSTLDFDTEIGLYSGAVTDPSSPLVATDDDDGLGTRSVLTFGTGSGEILGDSFNLDNGVATGEDGNLTAGQYTLVFGEFQVDFGDTLGEAESTGSDTGGEFEINFDFGVIPEPTSLGLIGLAGLALVRRR